MKILELGTLFIGKTVATYCFKAEGHVAVFVRETLKVTVLAVIVRSVEVT